MTILRNLVLAFALLVVGLVPASAAAKFLVLCSTSCAWDNTNDAIWSTSSGGSNNTTHPVAGDTVTMDASTCVGGTTCTITGGAVTLSFTSLTFGACTASTTGCILDFSVNNPNVIASNISGTGTGTRNFKMGNGTYTLTINNGTAWDFGTTTNLTFTANSSTISFSGSSVVNGGLRLFQSGGLTYSTVSFSANSAQVPWSIGGAPTIATMNVTGPVGVVLTNSATVTVSNAFNWVGTSSNPIYFLTNNSSATATLSVASGAPTIAWASIHGIIFTGGATFTATNSLDLGGNTGITISPPSVGGGGRIIGG